MPSLLFINGLDKDNANFIKTVAAIKEKYGNKIAPMIIPNMVDEWGGFKFIPESHRKTAQAGWGYHGLDLKTPEELCAKIEEQVDVMIADPGIAGYCYTQLTDVEQEENGVYCYDRTPKVPGGDLKRIFGKKPAWDKTK